MGSWRGTSICPGFCQSEGLISGEEPKGGSETPRSGAARSLPADGMSPSPQRGRLPMAAAQGGWLRGAAGTWLASPSLPSPWDGDKTPLSSAFQSRALKR